VFKKINNLSLQRPEIVLFARIRNEDYFIRHFLEHYRAIGIEHFYFADDRSDDGTRELLLEQPDCTVIESEHRFYETVDGEKVKDIVLIEAPRQLVGDGWILTVDLDEFLVLPEPYATVGELARDLDARGEISCTGVMVDFYPATLAKRFADRKLSPFKAFPFFDVGPYFIWEQGQILPTGLHAGVRHRINEWMFERDRGKVWKVYRPTMLHKVPLLRWGRGMLPKQPHSVDKPPYTGTQVVLAHFKFYPDLDAKIEEGIESEFYHAGSYYYRLLKHYLPIFADRSLIALTSRRFKERSDLARARLLFANGRPF
jgi:hypothetical protein